MKLPFDLSVIGAGLPFASAVEELSTALARIPDPSTSITTDAAAVNSAAVHDGGGPAAVVQAPPGTGKTTMVPPAVVNLLHSEGERGRVVVTQPRRVAARAAATRLSQLSDSELGKLVGYSVRGDRKVGPETLVEFVTPGILLRRLLRDPELAEVDAVILDEVHERALDSDLLIGMLAEVRLLRPELKIVAMSATLDAGRFAEVLGGAPVVDCPAVLFPLEVSYAPSAGPRLGQRGVERAFLDHLADVAAREHGLAAPGVDALVFVPGAREVRHVAERLARLSGPDTEILQLMGASTPAEQMRAVSGRRPGEKRRIIVSTSLAESSLTVPGVRLVIDSCLAREPRRDAARGMSGLVTVAASRASCEQRAGRAARLGPGRVVRICDEKTYAAAPAQAAPEIASADLTEAALFLACWGSPGGEGLPLPSPPPALALRDATEVLANLGAISASGQATAQGRRLASIPADPRLGRALLEGASEVGERAAAEVVALLSLDSGNRGADADLGAALRGVKQGKDAAATSFRHEVERLLRLLRSGHGPAEPGIAAGEGSSVAALGAVVGLAFPERIAHAVPGQRGVYLMASGSRAALPQGSALAHHEWLAIAEASRAEGASAAGTGAVIRSAAPIDWDAIERAADHLLQDSVEAEFDQGRVKARRVRRLGAIVLDSTPVRASAEEGRAAVLAALRQSGLGLLNWDDSASALRNRMAFLHTHLGDPWPDMHDAGLLARAEDWLGPELDALAAGKSVGSLHLSEALRRLLPWPAATRFEELAPERLEVPSGSRIRITYPEVGSTSEPVVAVKLQECFGWAQTPRLAEGRVPVLFHLLSPAGRPLAVTADLASFWAGPYSQVRAEMRGKYPRHPWPEDPWTHVATAKTKRRLEG